jgi:hypothetical protein
MVLMWSITEPDGLLAGRFVFFLRKPGTMWRMVLEDLAQA